MISLAEVPIDRALLAGSAVEVAPRLLNLLLVRDGAAGRIVEVEAYEGPSDPASHAFRGRSQRTATMFGPPGHLYVYFTYGMHHCANVVCGPEGTAAAVLLRALEPVRGLPEMRARRGAVPDLELAKGPARLCAALGIDRSLDGADLLAGGAVALVSDGVPPPPDPVAAPRIGISERAGDAKAWRWNYSVEGSRYRSRSFRRPG